MIEVLQLVFLTLLPGLELRLSIPFGIGVLQLPWLLVFIVCVLTNIVLGPVIYFLLDKFVHLVLKINFVERIWLKCVLRAQRKGKKYVERFGLIGLALFVAIPLPGSGSYTGALIAYLFGVEYRNFFLANLIGVIIAGIIVTIAVLFGLSIFEFIVCLFGFFC